jgi:hypothetical protein
MHGLFNYLGKIKVLVFERRYFMPISFGVVIGDWLFNKDSTHAKNKRIHIGKH